LVIFIVNGKPVFKFPEVNVIASVNLLGPASAWANQCNQPWKGKQPAGGPGVQSPVFSQNHFAGRQEEGSPQKSGWDILAKTSLGTMFVVNTAMLFSPLMTRAARCYLASPEQLGRLKDSPEWVMKAVKHIADREDKDLLLKTLTGLNSYATLAQLNTGYQVGLNTQQPSKSLASLSGTVSQLATMWKPGILYTQAWSYLTSFFWFSGETNDIKNNNTPGQRREWDQKRLLRAWRHQSQTQANQPSFGDEMKSVFRFMGNDCRYTLSSGPWKNLLDSIRKRESLLTPQPYQTAIGAQLNFLGFLGATGAFLSQVYQKIKNPALDLSNYKKWPDAAKKMPEKFSKFTKFVMLFSIISYLPVLMRALKSKNEMDGALTFIGVPLITARQVYLGGLSLKHWQGLFNLGGPVVNEGKRINSKKYRAQVNYLEALYQQAQANPNLTASQVLAYLQSNPMELDKMALSMGQFRVDFILNMLREGIRRQSTEQITLADYLLPVMKMGA